MHTEIKVRNIVDDIAKPNAHVLISTLGKLLSFLEGRTKIDISELKVFVIDEADVFFETMKDQE